MRGGEGKIARPSVCRRNEDGRLVRHFAAAYGIDPQSISASSGSVSELGRLYPISLTAVQKHVEVLVDAGLVSKHRRGREQIVRGEVDQIRSAHEVLDELETVWRARLGRFEGVLNETTGKESE
jgi:DNA-binding transcriptional ArsR family regulator